MISKSMEEYYPTLPQAFGLFAFFIFMNIIIAFLSSVTIAKLFDQSTNLFITYIITFSLTIAFGITQKKGDPRENGLFSFAPVKIRILPILIVLTLVIQALLDPITDLIPMPDFFYKMFLELMADRSFSTFVMMVIAAPLLEEILFRGIFLDGFLKNYSARKSIFWSSLFFAVAHMNPWQFIVAFVLGLLIGYVYLKTRSLLPCIFIHFIANSAGYSLRFLFDVDENKIITTREMIGNNLLYFSILILCAIIAYALLLKLGQIFNEAKAI